MKSSHKVLKINSLCYRDRFVKQFPTFVEELKELNLYEEFMVKSVKNNVLLTKSFYELSFENKNYYHEKKENFGNTIKDLSIDINTDVLYQTKSFTKLFTPKIEFPVHPVNFKTKTFKKLQKLDLFTLNFLDEDIISKIQDKKAVMDLRILKKKPVVESEFSFEKNNEEDKLEIVADYDQQENIYSSKPYKFEDYSTIKYDSTQDYTFHETDAEIFTKQQRKEQKKERKRLRVQKKQEKLEKERVEAEKEAKREARLIKGPSLYDILNMPLELRIAKYDVPLYVEEREEEEEYVPIDWEAEDLKYLIIVPHIRNIKFFDGAVGFSFGMHTGKDLLPVAVTEERVGSYLGSFIFTKRLTREIHAKKNKKGLKRSGGKR